MWVWRCAKRSWRPNYSLFILTRIGTSDGTTTPIHCIAAVRSMAICSWSHLVVGGGPNKALGHRKQSEGRLRSKEILEAHDNYFGRQLMIDRVAIERFFGNLVNGSMGLSCLPPWVRTYPRVHRWVQAKMIINAQKNQHKILSCAA